MSDRLGLPPDLGCLFPREQGVTGMNPTALPASLTGRIWFWCRYCELRRTKLLSRSLEASPTPSRRVPFPGTMHRRSRYEPRLEYLSPIAFEPSPIGDPGRLDATMEVPALARAARDRRPRSPGGLVRFRQIQLLPRIRADASQVPCHLVRRSLTSRQVGRKYLHHNGSMGVAEEVTRSRVGPEVFRCHRVEVTAGRIK